MKLEFTKAKLTLSYSVDTLFILALSVAVNVILPKVSYSEEYQVTRRSMLSDSELQFVLKEQCPSYSPNETCPARCLNTNLLKLMNGTPKISAKQFMQFSDKCTKVARYQNKPTKKVTLKTKPVRSKKIARPKKLIKIEKSKLISKKKTLSEKKATTAKLQKKEVQTSAKPKPAVSPASIQKPSLKIKQTTAKNRATKSPKKISLTKAASLKPAECGSKLKKYKKALSVSQSKLRLGEPKQQKFINSLKNKIDTLKLSCKLPETRMGQKKYQ